jgi:phospholipid transport system substrate-binding protein
MGAMAKPKILRFLIALTVTSAFLWSVQPSVRAANASADPAVGQIQQFCDSLLDTMKRAKELGIKGRYEVLKPTIEKVFDLPDMTKIAVGPTWPTISSSDQKALIAAFARLTIANYASNFDGYDGEQFVVDPNVITRGEDKLVQTKLVGSDQVETPFIYRMRQSDGLWKAIDIFLNGYVSQIAQRRSDFASTISSEGPKGLIKKINQLGDDLLKDK